MINRLAHLRVSLLKACDLNCFYCLPPSFERVRKGDITPVERFKQALSLLVPLGVRKIRFTGGEPTLYGALPELISYAKSLKPDITVALTTNGRRLAGLAKTLADVGLDSVNISIDTVSRQKFSWITESDSFEKVVAGLESAIEYVPEVKLNTVAMRGVNDDEIVDLITFANRYRIDIRFIEYMPSKYGDRVRKYISSQEIRKKLPFALTPVVGTTSTAARYYVSDKIESRIGFVSSVSAPFCSSCDRLRLTSDGKLYTCLFSNRSFDLFSEQERPRSEVEALVKSFLKGKEFIAEKTNLSELPYEPSFTEIGG